MNALFHYCSSSNFLKIVEQHAVYLSSLSLSNDTLEGKLVARAFETLGQRDKLAQATVERLRESLEMFEEILDGLGFCLSEDGDLLSQWRGYAGDRRNRRALCGG